MDNKGKILTLLLATVLSLICIVVGLPLLFFSCGSTQTEVLTVTGIELSAEGPLFSGSNTAQGICRAELDAWLKSRGKTSAEVREVRLTRAQVYVPDTTNLDGLASVTLMFASDNIDMQTMGALNPIPAGQHRIDIPVAQAQQQIKWFVVQPAFSVVLDADLKADSDAGLGMKADLEFSVSIHQ
ncbi:MAG: hypothetical protein SFV52_04480 [Saprospiraceae bacterium]|nr:hypothetical protein [Saprospiraceae bacterium]